MAAKTSAGLLLYRPAAGAATEVLIGHMGGPFWAKKDARAWSIPKGEYTDGESPREAAVREFTEELGIAPPPGEFVELGMSRASGGKVITVYGLEGDLDLGAVVPGTFSMEWPPRSGRTAEFPEIDRVMWAPFDVARDKLVASQVVFVDRLAEHLGPA